MLCFCICLCRCLGQRTLDSPRLPGREWQTDWLLILKRLCHLLKKLAEIQKYCVYHNVLQIPNFADFPNDSNFPNEPFDNFDDAMITLEKPLARINKKKAVSKTLPESSSVPVFTSKHTKMTMDAVSNLCSPTSIIRGSFHQGDDRLLSAEWR